MLVCKFIRVAIVCLAAIAVPIYGTPTGSSWDSTERGMRQRRIHHGSHRHSQRFERGAGQGPHGAHASEIHEETQEKLDNSAPIEPSASAPRPPRYLHKAHPSRFPCLQAEESLESAPRQARYLHLEKPSQILPLAQENPSESSVRSSRHLHRLNPCQHLLFQTEEPVEPIPRHFRYLHNIPSRLPCLQDDCLECGARHARYLHRINPSQVSPLASEELLDVALRQPRYVQIQNIPAYAAQPASYVSYSRPSRSRETSASGNMYEEANTFRQLEPYSMSTYGAGLSSLPPNVYREEVVLNRVDDIPGRFFASNPEQLPRLYIIPATGLTSAMESAEQELPVDLPTPAITEIQPDVAMSPSTVDAEFEREQEVALHHAAKDRLPKRQIGPLKKRGKGARKIFRASEVVYRPEIVYNPEDLSPEMSITKMSSQENVQMNNEKELNEENMQMNDEKTLEEAQKEDVEDDAQEIPIPDTSFDEEVIPSVVKARSTNEGTEVIMNGMDNDETMKGDVVLPESMEDESDAQAHLAGGSADSELVEEKDRDLATESTTSMPVIMTIKNPDDSQLNEDPDLVDDIENPPTQTMTTNDKVFETTSTPKN